MKAILFSILLALTFSLSAQTYLKVADREEYKRYEAWCKVLVERHLEICVKIKLQAVNGIYTSATGSWVAVYPFTGTLVKIGTVPVVNQDEKMISFYTLVKTWRINPSVTHFYANWEKIKLEHGLVSN